jgi:hypothetical protein
MEAAQHLHAKAFRLISYRSADGKLEEQIWNSRDRAAPIVVYARDAETPTAGSLGAVFNRVIRALSAFGTRVSRGVGRDVRARGGTVVKVQQNREKRKVMVCG